MDRDKMDRDMRHRFLQAEETLLDLISGGDATLVSFESFRDSLFADFSRCLSSAEISDETISLANLVASRIAIIATCFSDFHKAHEELRNQLLDGFESILDGFSRVTISPPSTLSAQNPPESCLPPFIKSAYTWLIANLHNPYPSSNTKASIASSSGSSINSVSVWFVSIRRRVGWTTICRKHFNNCRANTVDAAYRVLVKEDPIRVLPHPVYLDFMQMKAAAEALYASTFSKRSLAGDLDAIFKDTITEDRLRLEQEKVEHVEAEKIQREEENEMQRNRRAHDRLVPKILPVFASYPSPSHSRSSSPVPSLEESWTDESEDEEDDVNPPVLAGRKRRASFELNDSGRFPCMDRPLKRLRSCAKMPRSLAQSLPLPSPPSSPEQGGNGEVETVTPTCPFPWPSRKRSTNARDVLKCPRGVPVRPRVHAVSDPLPRSSVPLHSDIDDWFHMNFFDIPPPVENVGFDHSTPLDIELFSGYTFSDTQKNFTHPILTGAPSFDQQVVDLEVPSLTSFPTPLSLDDNLDHFLDALSTFAPGNSCAEAITPNAFDTISPPLDLIDAIPSGACTWMNSDQPFLPTMDQFSHTSSCSDLSQILPEIDLSVLQLPPLSFPTPQHGACSPTDAGRLAKLEQLHLLREQARLLEQDLAGST